ncbi:AAA family ATPase [Burkholderia sp. A1]|uniref:ATP-dependent nuclease n=1 Tax=Burkholderia sp. A1 TaxID=148446 RepID=UPI0009FFAC84|nr:AAA family ATPase [Burkholderia sp. A1]
MHVSKIIIQNFRSFREKTEIPLSPGMNLVLGENNSGKSTILEAFSLSDLVYAPHLSLASKPHPDDEISSVVQVGLEFEVGIGEVWRYLGETIKLPVPKQNELSQDFPKYLSGLNELKVGITAVREKLRQGLFFSAIYGGVESFVSNDAMTLTYTCSQANGITKGSVVNQSGGMTNFNHQANALLGRLYKFRAERMNISRCMFGIATVLAPNAANLAECLNSLQSHNSHLFEEYVNKVRHIFPSVHRVQAVPVSGTELEIRTSLVSADRRRPDLAISLSQSGTGISQVLSILYVAMNATTPITIAIDEPNSFLHPKAVRALLTILNALPIKHQYIITTHSPEVIRASNAKTVTVVENHGGQSKIEVLDPRNLDDVKSGLASIGVRLSDLYGADRILWVEGETEELTFPKIAAEIAKLDVLGVAMLKVNATGDFEATRRVRPRMVFETYEHLSKAAALLPPAVGFIFDREGRTASEIADLERESGNSVKFLSRTCFENYIVHPVAIAVVLSQYCGEEISPAAVEEWIARNGLESKYITSKWQSGISQPFHECENWLIHVNAPKLLKDAFNLIPENPEEYRKTTHSIAITDWLIRYCPDHLRPLADLLTEIIR